MNPEPVEVLLQSSIVLEATVRAKKNSRHGLSLRTCVQYFAENKVLNAAL